MESQLFSTNFAHIFESTNYIYIIDYELKDL